MSSIAPRGARGARPGAAAGGPGPRPGPRRARRAPRGARAGALICGVRGGNPGITNPKKQHEESEKQTTALLRARGRERDCARTGPSLDYAAVTVWTTTALRSRRALPCRRQEGRGMTRRVCWMGGPAWASNLQDAASSRARSCPVMPTRPPRQRGRAHQAIRAVEPRRARSHNLGR